MPAVVRIPTRARKVAPPNPQNDPRFKRVVEQLKADSTKLKQHPTPAKKAAEAAAAAKGPPNEKKAGAQAKQVDKIEDAPSKKPESSSFLALLRAEIEKAMPKTLGDTEKFMKGGSAEGMKGSLKGNVSQQKEQATGDVKSASKQTPSESGVQGKQATPVPGEPASAPPAVDGGAAMPAPKPDAEVSLQDSKKDTDQAMKDAEVTDTQLQKANDPRFSAVVSAKGAVAQQADAAPAAYRGNEKAALAQAVAKAGADAKKNSAGMAGAKSSSKSAVLARQQAAKAKDEAARKKVADDIEAIYNETKKNVEQKLSTLEEDVNRIFDSGTDAALATMKDYVEDRIFKYKLERYLSIPVVGPARWIKDQFMGLPPEVNAFYVEGRNLFTGLMDKLVVQVANLVETRLKEAKQEVANGQAKIKTYVAGLPKNLQSVGQAAQKEVAGRFEELERGIDEKKNQLAQQLADKYKEAFEKADKALQEIQDSNKGLVAAFVEKLGEVIKMLTEFKAKLMAVIKKGEEAIKLVLADPIGFLGNLLAALKQGFNQFVSNIWTHLKKGFMSWLFGELTSTGIAIPSDLSLSSILKLVLSILGLTWERARAEAVKMIGPTAVTIIEKLVEYIQALWQGGPAALWEKVKEDLSNLKAMVIDAIQDWLITTIVKRAVAKIVTMFNPAGAIVQAVMMIYSVVMFVIERANQILEFVEAVVNSIAAIAKGAIGGAATWIENALGRLVPVVIGLLASLIGLGGIGAKIKEIVTKAGDLVWGAIRKFFKKAIAFVKKMWGKLTGKGKEKEKDKEKDPEHDAKVKKGLAQLDALDSTYAKDGKITRDNAEKIAAKVKADNPVFKSLKVVDGKDTWDYDYVASPGDTYKGAAKGSGQLKVTSVKIKDPEKAEKVEKAMVSGKDWELAIAAAVVKEIFVPKWEVIIRVPIEVVVKGQKQFQYPSREDLARLKVQRGHRAGGTPTRYPDVSMEVKKPGGGGALKEVRIVEITLVEDFTAQGDFAKHKADQFTYTTKILKEKYGDDVPIKYYFTAPREPTAETKDFIVGTLQSQGLKNVTVIWVVVKTK
jgi:hypothetical protein